MSSVVKPEIARAVTPLGILVEHLNAAARIVEANPNIPAELTENLLQAWRLAVGLDPKMTQELSRCCCLCEMA